MDRAVEEIKAASEQVRSELETIKLRLNQDVDTALEEVEPLLLSKYGPVFRALTEESVPFPLFVYTTPSCTVPSIPLQFTLTHLTDLLQESRLTPAVPKLAPLPLSLMPRRKPQKSTTCNLSKSVLRTSPITRIREMSSQLRETLQEFAQRESRGSTIHRDCEVVPSLLP